MEEPIVAAKASVMIYDDENKKWVHSGTSSGLSKVNIYQHKMQNTFRVVGRKLHDHELVINCSIIKGLKYNKATPTFHQWRDTKQVYGLNFHSKEDAENFANSMLKVLDMLNSAAHNNLTGQIINGNSAVMNNQLNQNLINPQTQQNQQPVYAHLNETQQQIIKQYQAPPEYSEVIQTTNNRTNGWSNQNQVQFQNQLSQPSSLDLNDWRAQQQLQLDLNQLNLNNGSNQQQVQQIMSSIQPIYGHHRNSLPNQANAQQQIQQNAQLIQAQHQQQQLIHQQQINSHQIQLSNGLQQTNLNQQLVQQQQQITSPPQLPVNVNQQQAMINQQPTQATLPPNQNNLNNSTQQQTNNVPSQPSIPAPPPPPPMPNLNLGLNKPSTTTTSSSTNQQQTSNSSLASALANAKLKKTPNKDELVKEKSSASFMDEMAKTLARRRAQAEGNHLNGNCNNNDDNDSLTSNRLKNGWVDKKSSPNKDNDTHSRLRTGSSDHTEFDVEKFKQDVIMEMKKEMNKIKLEIIEAIKTELNRNY